MREPRRVLQRKAATPEERLPQAFYLADLQTSQEARYRAYKTLSSGEQALDREARSFQERALGHDFSRLSVVQPQTRLTVSQPGDLYEQEADRVAEEVMRMPEPQLQRSCACGGQCPKCQTEQPDQEQEHLQAKRVGSSDLGQTAVPSIVHEVLRSPGQPLDPSTRAFMESRFGHDFSGVRVHMDTRAAESARAMSAYAYTGNQNIVFSHGHYSPHTIEGKKLIAHELVHTLQQRNTPPVARLHLADRDEVAEIEAEVPASQTLRYQPVVRSEVRGAIQRQPVDAGVPDNLYVKQVNCLALNGACYGGLLSAGPIDSEKIAEVNSRCRDEEGTGYEGPDIFPSDEECRQVMTGELVESAKVDQLEQLYLDTVDQLSRSGKPMDSGQLEALNLALQELRRAGRQPVRTHQSGPVEAGGAGHAGLGAAVVAGTTLTWGTGTLTGGGATVGGTAASGAAASMAATGLVVGGIVLVGYGLYRLYQWASRDAKVDPQAAARVQRSVDELMRRQTSHPEPAPKPVPVGPSPAPLTPENEERRRRKCREKDPCDTPLPIRWPRNLPLPSDRRQLIRTPSGDEYIEPEKRSKPQNDMRKKINDARERGDPPPDPCFRHDAESNAPYEAHHIHPLYLGGAEDTINLCALRTDYHQRGHPELNNQADMLNDPVWIACRICNGYLPSHPAQQEYEITGRK